MATLMVACRHVWLSPAPLSRGLQADTSLSDGHPGPTLWPRSSQVAKARQQLANLRPTIPPRPCHTAWYRTPPCAWQPAPQSKQVSMRAPFCLPFVQAHPGMCRPDKGFPPDATPSHQRAVGGANDCPRWAVGRFFSEHLKQWREETPVTWVLLSLSEGYNIQFSRQPPRFICVRMTLNRDPQSSLARR